ncbi:DUF3617 family protein [Azoarcus sp. L1K30]|uniref:DUF3617 domain-containing protein n=1 Tax=Azoarcus sp. L1K30 TaxID=2820277 RepID=UPI001B812F10|nr:DUF3617 family protein [Azoarcus sp. L1K30]MBR0567356.1 DUF3617 family protein [Azoarcus sp. L1K30]
MRIPSLPLACFLLSVASVGPCLAETPSDLPKRKPGLWEMKTTMVEMGGMGQTLSMCVGAQTDDLLVQQGDEQCSQKSYRRNGDRIVFNAVCQTEGSTAKIEGSFSGDFVNRYSGEVRSTYTPPLQGMKTMTLKQEARWTGACKPGQKPGDVVMQGMNGINIEEMMKNMPQAPRR